MDVTVGAATSIEMARPLEADETLPDASVAVAVIVCDPEDRAPEVYVQLPEPSDVVTPKVPSADEITVTVALASEVPVKVGVVSDVRLSVSLAPRSEAALMSGVEGADGAEASMVMESPEDADDTFPAASVAVAVIV